MEILNRNKTSAQYGKLLEVRQQLPVYASRADVVDAVRRHQVVVVAGETGSGKSTQIPQFILEVRSCILCEHLFTLNNVNILIYHKLKRICSKLNKTVRVSF